MQYFNSKVNDVTSVQIYNSQGDGDVVVSVQGEYEYWHYLCDSANDRYANVIRACYLWASVYSSINIYPSINVYPSTYQSINPSISPLSIDLFTFTTISRGWGCGYRTLQTMISWVQHNRKLNKPVPSIRNIQVDIIKQGFPKKTHGYFTSCHHCICQ